MFDKFKKNKDKLFGNDIEINCQYCENSNDFDGADVCKLGRYLEPDGTCKKFVYDPLKRTPTKLPPLKQYSADDFKL